MIYVCKAVNEKCWNWYDSFGEICVGCGCCSKHTKTRQRARLEVLKRDLEYKKSFDGWLEDEEMRNEQKKNNAASIKYIQRKIRYYENKLKGGDTK